MGGCVFMLVGLLVFFEMLSDNYFPDIFSEMDALLLSGTCFCLGVIY